MLAGGHIAVKPDAELDFELPPAGQLLNPVSLSSDVEYGLGVSSAWPTYYCALDLVARRDMAYQAQLERSAAALNMPTYRNRWEAIYEIALGMPPPVHGAHQLFPAVVLRLADHRARIGRITLDASAAVVTVDEGSVGSSNGFTLLVSSRDESVERSKQAVASITAGGEYRMEVGMAPTSIYASLLDEGGNQVDSRDLLTTTIASQLIEAPTLPGQAETQAQDEAALTEHVATSSERAYAKDRKGVFVVFGRDLAARDALFDFLRALELKPKEWGHLLAELGEGSPYVGPVIDKAFEIAQAVVVLLSPDDEAKLAERYLLADDPDYERTLTPQPRQNVLFEAGMAFGRQPARTIIFEIAACRPFSDITGRHKVRLSSANWRHDLAQRLRNAGCDINDSGSDWLSAGKFPAAPPTPSPLAEPPRPTDDEEPGGNTDENAQVRPEDVYGQLTGFLEGGRQVVAERTARAAAQRLREVVLRWRFENRQSQAIPTIVRNDKHLESWRPVFGGLIESSRVPLGRFLAIGTACIEYDSSVLDTLIEALLGLSETPFVDGNMWVIDSPHLMASIGANYFMARAVALRRWSSFRRILLPTTAIGKYHISWIADPRLLYPNSLGGHQHLLGELVKSIVNGDGLNERLSLTADEMVAAVADANVLAAFVAVSAPADAGLPVSFWGFRQGPTLALLRSIARDPVLQETLGQATGESWSAFAARFKERFEFMWKRNRTDGFGFTYGYPDSVAALVTEIAEGGAVSTERAESGAGRL